MSAEMQEDRITPQELLGGIGYSPADNLEQYKDAVHWKSKLMGYQINSLFQYKYLLEAMSEAPLMLGPMTFWAQWQRDLLEASLTKPIRQTAKIAALNKINPNVFEDLDEKIESLYAGLLYDLCGYFMRLGRFDAETAIFATTSPWGKEFLKDKMEEFAWLEYSYNSLGLTRLAALKEMLQTLVIAITEQPLSGKLPFMKYDENDNPELSFEEYLKDIRNRLTVLHRYKAFNIKEFAERATGGDIGYSSHEIVDGSRIYMASLRRYLIPEGVEPNGKVLYLITPLINMPEIFDLAKGKSVIEGLLSDGFTVYMADFGEPGPDETELGFEFYGKLIHDKFLDLIAERHPDEEIQILGYCIGGTIAVPYLARRAEELRAEGKELDIKRLALMAAPVKFDDVESGQQEMLETIRQDYNADLMEDLFGTVNIPPQLIETGMNEIQPGVQYSVTKGFFERADSSEAVLDAAPFLFWLTNGRKFPYRAHREWIQNIFMENRIYSGKYELPSRVESLDGQPVNMEILREAGLVIFDYRGSRDPIAPAPSCVASETWGMADAGSGNAAPGSRNVTIEKNIGHIFVVSKRLLSEYLDYLKSFFQGEL
jgi:poly(3-hydroxyalkanoate) synthetase